MRNENSIDRKKLITVDGRVFSSSAHDRGMGRYVRFLIETFHAAGFDICLITYPDLQLAKADPILSVCKHVAPVSFSALIPSDKNLHLYSHEIERIIKKLGAFAYVDTAPFLSPWRFDLTACPTIAVAYDLIPLRYPNAEYLTCGVARESYQNGLERLCKADAIIAISHYTKKHLTYYLGIDPEKIAVVYPCLDGNYFQEAPKATGSRNYIFSIVGGHTSKNTARALSLLQSAAASLHKNVRITVPTVDQHCSLRKTMGNQYGGFSVAYNVSEADKIKLQTSASLACHLSIDEGFGIPLLEALYVGTPALCMDIDINREILAMGGMDYEDVCCLLPAGSTEIEGRFLGKLWTIGESDKSHPYFAHLRQNFQKHWFEDAPKILSQTVDLAQSAYDRFIQNLQCTMNANVLGIPFCGVADYAAAIPLGLNGTIIVYTQDIKASEFPSCSNLRLKTALSFGDDADVHSRYPVIYHLAVSDRLLFGIENLHAYGKSTDIVIVHDQLYLYGLYTHFHHANALAKFYRDYFIQPDDNVCQKIEENTRKEFIRFSEFRAHESKFSSSWLTRKGALLVSHLTPEAARQSAKLEHNAVFAANQHYIPMGINDRISPGLARAERGWRRNMGIMPWDLLLGAFGSVTNNKFLLENAEGVVLFLSKKAQTGFYQNVYFMLCGTIVDTVVFDRIKMLFSVNGFSQNFIHLKVDREFDFDALMTASDILFSCRIQDRGQLSHSYVRALSLGRPIITNSASGYDAAAEFTLANDRYAAALADLLDRAVAGKIDLAGIRRDMRSIYEKNHTIQTMVQQALQLSDPALRPQRQRIAS